MNIPQKPGDYTIDLGGGKTALITISKGFTRVSRLDNIGGIKGDYKRCIRYNVDILDETGEKTNLVHNTEDYQEYYDSILKYVRNNTETPSSDPRKITGELRRLLGGNGFFIMDENFKGIVKGQYKFLFKIDDYKFDKEKLISMCDSLGIKCKISDKTYPLRASMVYNVNIYTPLDFDLKLDESINRTLRNVLKKYM